MPKKLQEESQVNITNECQMHINLDFYKGGKMPQTFPRAYKA
jgi:hypothetical protein